MKTGKVYQNLTVDTHRSSALAVAKNRLIIGVVLFCIAFLIMIGRTIELGISAPKPRAMVARQITVPEVRVARADIVDRNGEILATNLETSSLFAVPRDIKDPADVSRKLVSILPELSLASVEAKLASGKKFVWLKRKLTPRQKWAVNAIGEPALRFEREEERIYPHGRLAAHVLGYVDVDGNGLGGVEHFFNAKLGDKARTSEKLQLSLDIRVQYALADELATAMRAYQAIGGAGLVMDVATGEIIAMVSMPDFDPNNVRGVADTQKFNRATKGVYELGSTFKTFTFANALDDGIVTLEDGYDATKPLRISRFLIRDDHPKKRYLTVPEIFTYSSNIGTAQMALDIGAERQQEFLGDLGLLQAANVELTEVGAPLVPSTWRKSSTMTISYGHGLAVSPLQLASGISAMVNGGRLLPATLVHSPEGWRGGKQVISADTSRKIRQLLRMAVTKGTGSRADAIGYRVGGKTGTAEKAIAGGYARKKLISSFMGVFPMDDPRYAVFALLDEPKGTKETFGYRSGGWVAAPVVRNVILRSGPLLGIAPKQEDEGLYQDVALLIEDKKKK